MKKTAKVFTKLFVTLLVSFMMVAQLPSRTYAEENEPVTEQTEVSNEETIEEEIIEVTEEEEPVAEEIESTEEVTSEEVINEEENNPEAEETVEEEIEVTEEEPVTEEGIEEIESTEEITTEEVTTKEESDPVTEEVEVIEEVINPTETAVETELDKVGPAAPSLTVSGSQQGAVTYGTEGTSTFALTAVDVSGENWSIQWYDENEATISTAPATFEVSSGMNRITMTYDGQADAGTYKFTISCDNVTSEKATFVISKRTVTITSGTASKVYDGTPLTCEDFEASGFVDGEGVYVTCTGSLTGTAGQNSSDNNTFSYIAKEGTDLDNYDITEINGTLTVTANTQTFVVIGNNYKGTYDGQEHAFSAQVIAQNGIDYTSRASITYSTSSDGTVWSNGLSKASIKDAGKIYVKALATATIGGSTKSFESAVYTMEVTKKTVVLTSGSKTREYNGTALTYDDVSYGALAGGESFSPEPAASGTMTKVGETANTLDITSLCVKAGSVDTTANYEFIKDEGTLMVTPVSTPITITTPSNSKTYDGNVIDTGVASSNFDDVKASGDTLTIPLKYTDALKNAGEYANDIATRTEKNKDGEDVEYLNYIVRNGEGEDVTKCYTFAEPVIGTLTIEKRKVTLTSGTDLKIKATDGDYAYNCNVLVGGDGLLAGEELEYSGFKTVTKVSYTPTENTFEYAPASGSAFNENNYEITVVNGMLMLVEEMSIVGKDQTFKYDGTNHSAPVTLIDNGQGAAVTITYATSTDNKTWSEYSTTVPAIKDAGTLYIKAKAKKGVQEKDATYKAVVEKRNVILTSASATKEYDGTDLTCEGYTVSSDGFINNDGVDLTYTGKQKDVGNSENAFDYEIKAGTNADNYAIEKVCGTLTVTKNTSPIAITTSSDSWLYTGTTYNSTLYTATWDGQTLVNGQLYGDDVLQVVATATITDVGTISNTCETPRVVRNGVDVTDYYTFADIAYGTLTVTPRSITINTASNEKVYDGTPLTANNYTISGDGFVGSEGFATVNIAGTRTNAGTARNVLASDTPYTFNEDTNAINYNVTVKAGTLKVNKRKVTVTSGSAVSTYGSCPSAGLSNKVDCTVAGDGFVVGEAAPKGSTVLAKPTSEPSPSAPATADNMIDYGWTGNGNPANYEITEHLGTLMITNESANAALATDYEGIYDGQAHSGTFTTNISEPDSIQFSVDNKASWSEIVPSFTDVTLNGNEVISKTVYVRITKGGNVAETSYKVTIQPRTLKLTAGSAEKIYDGTALTCSSYIAGGDGFANATEQTDANVTTNGTLTDVRYSGKKVTTIANTVSTLSDNGSFKVSNYNISYYTGTLKVTPRKVVLKSDSITPATYDGKVHNCETVTEGGMGFVADQGVTYSDFAQVKDAGLYENSFKITAKPGTELKNYEVKMVYGLMRILPCEVTFTSASGKKAYDGKALKNKNITVETSLTDNAMPEGENVSFEVTGSQVKVGQSVNTFTWTITNYKEINYKVTKNEGTLKVIAGSQSENTDSGSTYQVVNTSVEGTNSPSKLLSLLSLIAIAGVVTLKKRKH